MNKKRYKKGGKDNPESNLTSNPTFKTWFAKNARRSDVMEASGNTDALKTLFLADIGMKDLPIFSSDVKKYGTGITKSGINFIGGYNKGGKMTTRYSSSYAKGGKFDRKQYD